MSQDTIWVFCDREADVWNRWKAGQSLHEIGRAFDNHIAAFALCCCLARHSSRRRPPFAAGAHASGARDISRGIASDSPLREIARRLIERPPH